MHTASQPSKAIPLMAEYDIARFWAKVVRGPSRQCWLWAASTWKEGGYGQFKIGNRMVSAHRVAYYLGTGCQPTGLYVLHCCDNKLCCNPHHLFLGTQQANMDDLVAKGLSHKQSRPQRGEQNGNARLTEDDVRAIRQSPDTQCVLADRYDVSQVMISRIRLRKAWSHVQ